jgi:type II secretory pathway pseudopilin PulG
MTSRRAAARPPESGFALLIVLLMAAMIAISLYMEAPRLAFQAQRQKEQMLMERGEQYKRAIGLFLRTNKNTRWPATIEELENYNNRRFLRHRYIDPLTGKDEWRLIHINNGVLTDSVTNKPKDQQQDHIKNGGVMELQGLSASDPSGGQQSVNAVTRRRPSDGGTSIGPDGQPLQGGVTPLPIDGASGATGPTSFNGIAGGQPPPNGATGIAGLLGIPTAPTGAPGAPAPFNYGIMGNGIPAVGGGAPAQPGIPGAIPGGFAGGIAGSTSGVGGGINPQAQAAADNLIQGLLTQPRPGGMNGLPTSAQSGIIGGGIAGVASKAEGDSIMVYADHSNYNEWEFIYDPTKFKAPQNPNTGSSVGTPASQLGSSANNATGPNVMNQIGTLAANLPGGVGIPGASGASGSTGAGSSSAFGQGGGPDIRPGKQ